VIMVVGFESGVIAVHDLVKDSTLKYFEEIHKARVLVAKILFKNPKIHNRVTILTTDENVSISII